MNGTRKIISNNLEPPKYILSSLSTKPYFLSHSLQNILLQLTKETSTPPPCMQEHLAKELCQVASVTCNEISKQNLSPLFLLLL